MIKEAVLDLFFPKYCLGCGKEGQYICKNCEIYMIDVPEMFGLTALWEYNGLIKEAIQRIKYGGEWDIVKELMEKKDFSFCHSDPALAGEESRRTTRSFGFHPQDDNIIVTFVPMTKKKERKRGFNQAEIIAKEIGRKLNKPVIKLLDKVKETNDQAGLNREERLKNLKGCFSLCKNWERLRLSQFARGEASPKDSILLVDDVYTTGGTMAECGNVLKKLGCKNIWGFTIAKTM